MHESHRLMRFLLVEDDDDHAKIVERTLTKQRILNKVDRVKDGADAMAALRCEGKFKDQQRPDVILLDLKLPKKGGLEILAEIKADPHLKSIPVVVLTTSNAESDKIRAYQNHANSYLVKPLDAECFGKMVDELDLYWGIWNNYPNP
jgi:DNA-binding response OmpR family regulator